MIVRQVDESLNEDKKEIIAFVNNDKDDVTELYKNISCSYYLKEYPKDIGFKDVFSFVYDFDSVENEIEPYRQLRTLISINETKYEMLLQESFVESDSMIYSITFFSIVLFGSLIIGVVLLQYWGATRIWNPFYKTLGLIEKYNPDNKANISFDNNEIEEFNTLNKALNKLSKRITDDFVRQKKFIDNVAHELQTPIAVAGTHLELLIQNLSLDEKSATIIEDIDNTLSQIKNINSTLLLMSRIENEQFTNKEIIDIENVIKDYLNNHIELLESKRITFSIDSLHQLKVEMDTVLADILIGNLLRNAIIHNIIGGGIMIHSFNNILEINNSGKFLKVNPNDLFKKHVKYSDNESSTGLGLSIVHEICKLYKFNINYQIIGDIHKITIAF